MEALEKRRIPCFCQESNTVLPASVTLPRHGKNGKKGVGEKGKRGKC
jgi:hypothetical protein